MCGAQLRASNGEIGLTLKLDRFTGSNGRNDKCHNGRSRPEPQMPAIFS